MKDQRMSSQKAIDSFLDGRSFAVVGVSRTGKKFGNAVYKALKDKGCTVFPLNPVAESINGVRCYARLKDLPQRVDGVVSVVPPEQTERLVKEAAESGIFRLWMQQGSESKKAIEYCEQYGIQVVYGRCILMFLEPVMSIHKFHKGVLRLFHRLPA